METKKVFILFVEDNSKMDLIRDYLEMLTKYDIPVSIIEDDWDFSWRVKYFVGDIVEKVKNFFAHISSFVF